MKAFAPLVGRQNTSTELCHALKSWVHEAGATVVGAMHVTCSDEAMQEGADAFRSAFAEALLPSLKHGLVAPFRVARLGGRYEWGAVRVAEANFATAGVGDGFKALIVKIDAHVSAEQSGSVWQFGTMARYGGESRYCGALAALLEGVRAPFVEDLETLYRSGEIDRLAVLRDPRRVDPALAPLFAAQVSARLQARLAAHEIQDHTPRTPTLYLIVHGTALNRKGPDAELTGGFHVIDRTGGQRGSGYIGLGDDPSRYRFESAGGRLGLADDRSCEVREPPNPRLQARARVRSLERVFLDAAQVQGSTGELKTAGGDERRLRAAAARLIELLEERSPVQAALLLLGEGALGVHHAYRLGQAGRKDLERHHARQALEEALETLESLSAERLARIARLLLEHHDPRRSGPVEFDPDPQQPRRA